MLLDRLGSYLAAENLSEEAVGVEEVRRIVAEHHTAKPAKAVERRALSTYLDGGQWPSCGTPF